MMNYSLSCAIKKKSIGHLLIVNYFFEIFLRVIRGLIVGNEYSNVISGFLKYPTANRKNIPTEKFFDSGSQTR